MKKTKDDAFQTLQLLRCDAMKPMSKDQNEKKEAVPFAALAWVLVTRNHSNAHFESAPIFQNS